MSIQSKRGFTLVEIMIIIVIIGLLAAVLIPSCRQAIRGDDEDTQIESGPARFHVIHDQYLGYNRVRILRDATTGHQYLLIYGRRGDVSVAPMPTPHLSP